MIYFSDTQELEDVSVTTDVDKGFAIILYNDDVNTFDHVIHCLIKYCKHTEDQAEQCAMIVHYKGKCQVKNGSEILLIPICKVLQAQGLSATLEQL